VSPPIELPGRFRAAVFDMDGLLLDSEAGWERAEAELFARRGLVYTEAERRATLGSSMDRVVPVFTRRFGLAPSDEAAIGRELMELVREEYAAGQPPRPGAIELVERLRGRLPMAVASNTGRELVEGALESAGIADAFDVVVTVDDVAHPKPAPDIYELACERLGVAPREAIAFEDSEAGVRSASAAGLTVVAVPQVAGLSLDGAHHVLESLAQLVD
jgi:HAD superfamily hydrolase (TIGR01509 family)